MSLSETASWSDHGHKPIAVMIDDPGSRDLDDAIAVEAVPDGGWRAVVYVAGVAAAVRPGSATDQTARKRVTSVYRPSGVFPMLGDRVERTATLTVDADREVLAVSMRFTADGKRDGSASVDRCTLESGSCVRLPYADVPAVVDDFDHRWNREVRTIHELASALRAQRTAAGAFAFYDLARGYAATEEGRITLIPAGQRTIGYVMVEELMIAAGMAVADWCVDHDIPILFRNHRTSLLSAEGADLATDIAASLHDPELFEQLRQRVNRSFGKATYDAVPRGHHGLRVSAYAHVTSPLRRYPDLVSQQMLWAHLAGQRAPYSHNQLTDIAEHVNRFVAAQQRRREEYFLEQKRREALRGIAERNYSVLDAGQWRRMFDVMTQNDPVEGIEDELIRRLDAQILVPNDVARIAAAGPAWTAVRQVVFPKVRARLPQFGPGVVSGRAQILGQDPAVAQVETVTDPAASVTPRFAARVVLDGQCGAWQVAGTKKEAATQAMWELLEVLCGHQRSVDAPVSWPDEPDGSSDGIAAVSCPAVVDVSAVSAAMASHLAGLSGEQRERAMSNPLGWLTTAADQLGVDPLKTEYESSGPSHAPVFVCTVAFSGVTHAVTAATKKQARVSAASELLAGLFEAVPYRPATTPRATRKSGGARKTTAVPKGITASGAVSVAVDELPGPAREHVESLTALQRKKAFKSPVSWLTNFASMFELGTPTYDYSASGPSHAQVITCTATMAGMRGTGYGPSKALARTAAMEGLLDSLIGQHGSQ
ncbi:RNB domain-containing ribonuclease [Mycobacteroides abscessus]|uniref:RNB domain-containing ribonuclease n=2 Tax=Bacteria TaxID=2 RepID=UPI0009CD5F0F|nr:RNB domain-containing ribonuclease [Mycobacteroides abscessus]SKU63207.1 Ribonuclease R [Mycobacteroides abscessus subsp. massiliense]